MQKPQDFIKDLLSKNGIQIANSMAGLFESFVNEDASIQAVTQIKTIQLDIMNEWVRHVRINDIKTQNVVFPNATVGKPYKFVFDINQLNWRDIVEISFPTLANYGLSFDMSASTIQGTPTQNGDFRIPMQFRIESEPKDIRHEKTMSFVINADPRSLWKDIKSDEGKDDQWRQDNFHKEDNVSESNLLGDKHIVVASKRGRSHANVGQFRDDDYAFKHFNNSGWSVVAVADGAGSAKFSRKGSQLSCAAVIDFFENNFTDEIRNAFDLLVNTYVRTKDLKTSEESISLNSDPHKQDDPANTQELLDSGSKSPLEANVQAKDTEHVSNQISKIVYQQLGSAARSTYTNIEEFARQHNMSLKDFHSTLIFTLIKRYPFGYVILSFGVGDCPIGLLNKDLTDVKLMNWLDVGEFGGGTRFITMPEIFSSKKFPTRFGFTVIEDFSYLFLMTDGIYDPKFIVESNLEKLENWKAFLNDLNGDNENRSGVRFDYNNEHIGDELSRWMDFWSPGNHDDRTLAIVF